MLSAGSQDRPALKAGHRGYSQASMFASFPGPPITPGTLCTEHPVD